MKQVVSRWARNPQLKEELLAMLHMLAALAESNFNGVRMAKVLDMSESTIRRRLRYGRVINLFSFQVLLLTQNTK